METKDIFPVQRFSSAMPLRLEPRRPCAKGTASQDCFHSTTRSVPFRRVSDPTGRSRANLALMQEADCAIINLTPFRGPSADVGSVFELGLMVGLGKPVFGYSNTTTDLLSRMRQTGSVLFDDQDGVWRDQYGMRVEDFGNADNLMIDACLAEQGHPLVRVNVADGDLYRDLRGFAECLRLAAQELLTAAAPVSSRRDNRA